MSQDDLLEISTSLVGDGVLSFGLQDIEQVRLLLDGDSVIDWHRLAFRDLEHVDEYLKLAGFDMADATDQARLDLIHGRALAYLDQHYNRDLPAPVRDPKDVRTLLLLASRPGKIQRDACMVLKVMHVVHHVAGRELLYRLPVSSRVLFHRVEQRVFAAVDGMKLAGIRISELAASRKPADSVLTKLLARPESLAASVHDRLRFRVITETLDDLLNALVFLTRSLLPFNYLVPGESRNDLIDLARTLDADPDLKRIGELLQRTPEDKGSKAPMNAFSGSGFRVINFIADVPIRVSDLLDDVADHDPENGAVVFVMVEFQLCDAATALANNTGANRHDLYKQRQWVRVQERLLGS